MQPLSPTANAGSKNALIPGAAPMTAIPLITAITAAVMKMLSLSYFFLFP
jgi:hypothetical protein